MLLSRRLFRSFRFPSESRLYFLLAPRIFIPHLLLLKSIKIQQSSERADPSIRSVQNKEDFLFGPTYLQLVADDLNVVKPFTILKRPRPGNKGKASMPPMDAGGVEFELEKNWILAHAASLRVKRDAEIAKKLADEAEWAAGGGVECGCCFDDFLPVSDL
jgi:hypothetical protein